MNVTTLVSEIARLVCMVRYLLFNYFLNCNVFHSVLLSALNPLHISSFFSALFSSIPPCSPLTPSHPSHLSASHPLSHLDFAPGATVCTCVYIHPVAVATAGGHISEWMNKRPGDPHPQKWREGEGEMENQILYVYLFRRGSGV